MNKYVESINLANTTENMEFNVRVPSVCPCCHTALEPRELISFYISKSHDDGNGYGKMFTIYFCPKCEEVFMALYSVSISAKKFPSKSQY